MPKTIDSKAIIKAIDASPMSFNGGVLDKQGFSEHSVVRDVHKIGKFINLLGLQEHRRIGKFRYAKNH